MKTMSAIFNRPNARSPFRPLLLLLLAVVVLAAGFGGTMRAQNADDQGVLAGFVSRLLSTPSSRVSIGSVEGALSSDAVIRNVSVADDAGVYLTIDRVRLVWRRSALLQRRIEIERLDVGRINLIRRPAAVQGNAEPGPILPELPLSLQVGRMQVDEFVLGEPVIGVAVRLSASGSASLGSPSEGLRAVLALRRLDQPGRSDLTLSFVPQGERLTIALVHDEPPGGIVARLAAIPGLPPVLLDLKGDGVLDDWRATLAFTGGPDLGADGVARLLRQGNQRALTLDLKARLVPLLPPVLVPIFAGVATLTGDVGFRDGGAIDLRNVRLTAPLARLDIAGTVDRDRNLDITARAAAVPNTGGGTGAATVLGAGKLDNLSFDGSVRGPVDAPTVRGALQMSGLRNTDFELASMTARLAMTPQASGPTALEMEATVAGFVPTESALAAAIGPDVSITMRAGLANGIADISQARISTPALSLDYTGRLGAQLVDGQLVLDSRRLQDFSQLAGRPLGGNMRVTAVLAGTRPGGDLAKARLRAGLAGTAEKLTLGDARLDALVGPLLQLDGAVVLADGSLTFEAMRARSPQLLATLAGTLNTSNVNLVLNATLPNLQVLDQRLRGRADGNLRLSGQTSDPAVDLELAAPEASALGRPIRGLTIGLTARTPLSAPRIALTGAGSINGKPLALEALAAGDNPLSAALRGWTVERLIGSLGSVAVNGTGRLDNAGTVQGRLSFMAGDLDDVSALALRKLGGTLAAEIVVAAADGQGQSLTINATGKDIVLDALRAGTLSADLAIEDAWRAPRLRGKAEVTVLQAGGERFDKLSLIANDAGGGATDLIINGRARGFDLGGTGRIVPGPPLAVRIEKFRAARGSNVIALSQPATLSRLERGWQAEGFNLSIGGGQVTLAGLVGPDLDATLRITALPLSAAAIFAPGLALSGVLDAQATFTGSIAEPRGPYSLNVRGFSLPATRDAGVRPLDVLSTGRLEGDGANVAATVRNSQGISLTVNGKAPFSEVGAINLAVRGTVDAALANARLSAAGQRLSGRVAIDASLSGTRARPDTRGSATLLGGTFTDAVQGVRITALEGRVRGDGETVIIERISGRTRGDGTLVASGRLSLDPARGFPGEIRLAARQAELLNSGVARLVANADLVLNVPLASSPGISGRVEVVSLDVRVSERSSGGSAPLADARHIAPPAQTRARLAQLARASAGRPALGGQQGAFAGALNLVVDAPGKIFVRGRGLDAELGGSLRLTGTVREPVALGGFDMRRGRLTILTQRLDFSRGRLQFAGSLTPELDFVAETRAGDVTARVTVSGPADQPSFAFSSSPALPEDEVLSRLLFARAAGGLSPFQAVQLAQAVAQLSGSGGPDVFDGVRRALGVDDLDITAGAGGPGIGVSRAISDRARIGIKAGATPQNTGVSIDIDLTRRLRLQGEISADGKASAGIGIEQEY